ncbi:MAG TPA: AraC family transcriptional regulator [Calditrichaeota bacterium]|nr:AraC family transcriptional regulator [Calditrichota bacterium]
MDKTDIIRRFETVLHHREFSVYAFCRRMRVAYSTFYELLKEKCGMSPGRYAENRRLERSLCLMVENNHTLKQIARRSGYPNYQTFYFAFKRRTGESPSDIKQRLEEGEAGRRIVEEMSNRLWQPPCKTAFRVVNTPGPAI